jgi:hypothetical protein
MGIAARISWRRIVSRLREQSAYNRSGSKTAEYRAYIVVVVIIVSIVMATVTIPVIAVTIVSASIVAPANTGISAPAPFELFTPFVGKLHPLNIGSF